MKDQLSPQPRGIINGWWPKYDLSLLTQWSQEGLAVSVGDISEILTIDFEPGNCFIRVHRVKTLDEYREVTDLYRRFTERYSFPKHELTCLFRGQSRDIVQHKCVVSTPCAFRNEALTREYLSLERNTPLATEWKQWAEVIERVLEIGDESGSLYRFSDPYQPARKVAPELSDKTLGARLDTNLQLMALAMHYGFPTASLDVTPNSDVSLWFALHVGEKTDDGLIRYVVNNGRQGTEDGPSVYIYVQIDNERNPTVDLSSMHALQGRAHRPFVQSAWGLPFYSHSQVFMGDMDARFFRVSGPCHRWATAVIKPEFSEDELKKARELYSAGELFPADDPLYRALVEANAPRCARYAV